VRTKDDVVAGLHTAIVPRETWDKAQALLARDGKRGGPRARREEKAMLLGLLKCARCGSEMRDHATTRGKQRYHSYVCARYTRDGATACPGGRLPLGDIEDFVASKVRSLGRDPAVVRATVASLENDRETRREELAAEIAEAEHQRSETKDGEATAIDERLATLRAEETGLAVKPNEADVTKALLRFEDLWAELFPAERARIVALVIHTIHYDPDHGELQINYREGGPAALLREAKGERS
jgi:hypothetical protein